MTSRNASFSGSATRAPQRPSVSSRLSFAVSSAAEQGDGPAAAAHGVNQQIHEEIEKIKRYEVGVLSLRLWFRARGLCAVCV